MVVVAGEFVVGSAFVEVVDACVVVVAVLLLRGKDGWLGGMVGNIFGGEDGEKDNGGGDDDDERLDDGVLLLFLLPSSPLSSSSVRIGIIA